MFLVQCWLAVPPARRPGGAGRVVACLATLAALLATSPASADFGEGTPPSAVEHFYLWKLTLTSDLDDPAFVPYDTETEILVRIWTYHDGHEAVYWQVFEDLDMDPPNDTSFTVVDGEGIAPERVALRLPVFVHGECAPFDAASFRIDVWEIDKTDAGKLLMEIGKAVATVGPFVPEALAWGLAAQATGLAIDRICNDETLLGTDGGLVPEGISGPYVINRHLRYSLNWDRDTLDATACRQGRMSAVAPSILRDVPDLPPAAAAFWNLIVKGFDPQHPFTKKLPDALQRWAALLRALGVVDSVAREPGTDAGWRTELIDPDRPFDSDANVAVGPGGSLFAFASSDLPRLFRREGECWISSVVDSSATSFDGTSGVRLAVDPAGRPRVIFRKQAQGDGHLYLQHAAWMDTGWVFSIIDTVSGNGAPSPSLSLAIDTQGRSHVAYQRLRPYAGYEFVYAVSSQSGWERDTIETYGEVGGHNAIAVDASGSPHVAYTVQSSANEYRTPEIRYARKVAGVWSIESLAATGITLFSLPCALALDGMDRPHVALVRAFASTFEVRYLVKTGATWTDERVRVVGYSGAPTDLSLALDPDDEPRMLLVEGSDLFRILHLRRPPGGGWLESVVDSTRLFGYTTSALAVDDQSRSHVVHVKFREAFPNSGIGDVPLAHSFEQSPGSVPERPARAWSWASFADAPPPATRPFADRRFAASRPPEPARPAYVDTSDCSWRSTVKDLIVQMGRDPLVFEIHEAESLGVDPGIVAQAWAALAAGDTLRSQRDHSAALESYRQGFLVLLERNHADFVTSAPPGPAAPQRPRVFVASQNPASSTVRLRIELPSQERVRVRVFDIAGRLTATIADGVFARGQHALTWSPENAANGRTSSGLYFVLLDSPSGRDVTRVVLVDTH